MMQALVRRGQATRRVRRIRGKRMSQERARLWFKDVGEHILCISQRQITAATKIQSLTRRRRATQKVQKMLFEKKQRCKKLAGLWWQVVGDYILCMSEKEAKAATKVQSLARRRQARKKVEQVMDEKKQACKKLAGLWWREVGNHILCIGQKEVIAATKVQTL